MNINFIKFDESKKFIDPITNVTCLAQSTRIILLAKEIKTQLDCRCGLDEKRTK